MAVKPFNFNEKWPQPLDDYLKENLDKLTCGEVHKLYSSPGLWAVMKEWRGTATGFDGLYELVVFRCVYHTLGGGWEERNEKGDQVRSFWKGNLRLSQGVRPSKPIPSLDRQFPPDILLERDCSPVAAAEIKVWLSGSAAALDGDVKRLKGLREVGGDEFRGAMIIGSVLNNAGKVPPTVGKALKEHRENPEERGWLEILTLDCDVRLFKDALTTSLGLERFVTS